MFETTGFIPHPGTTDATWGTGSTMRIPALQLASFACGVRLISEHIGGFTLGTAKGEQAESEPVFDTWQSSLFRNPAPLSDWSPMDVIGDTVVALETDRHAFLWKTMIDGARGPEVGELMPIQPDYVLVRRVDGVKKITARVNGQIEDITSRVVHIRGWSGAAASVTGAAVGDQHRRSLRTAAAYDEFRGRWFENDGTPGILLSTDQKLTRDDRKDLLDDWVRRHSRPENAGRPGLAWNGVKVDRYTPDLQQAQAVEIAEAVAREMGRILRLYPVDLLHVATRRPPQTISEWIDPFVRLTLWPRMRRIVLALHQDPDLFPDKALYPRFDLTEFVRGDIATTGMLVHGLVQSGVITPNEGRAMLGLPRSRAATS
jgi:HK97 family phage portal protein